MPAAAVSGIFGIARSTGMIGRLGKNTGFKED